MSDCRALTLPSPGYVFSGSPLLAFVGTLSKTLPGCDRSYSDSEG